MTMPDLRTFEIAGTVLDGASFGDYLKPGRLIDSDHPAIAAFAAEAVGAATDPVDKAVRLYHAVRDGVRYDPYGTPMRRDAYVASNCLAAGHGYCINKAGLMAAAARAQRIPARVGYADVRNHMSTRRLTGWIGTDVFYFHGYAELWLEDRWTKATPAFNRELTDKFRLRPLDWDGRTDSIYHPFDLEGRRHMEYLAYRGVYADLPFDLIRDAFKVLYPRMYDAGGNATLGRGDFAAEGAAEAARG